MYSGKSFAREYRLCKLNARLSLNIGSDCFDFFEWTNKREVASSILGVELFCPTLPLGFDFHVRNLWLALSGAVAFRRDVLWAPAFDEIRIEKL